MIHSHFALPTQLIYLHSFYILNPIDNISSFPSYPDLNPIQSITITASMASSPMPKPAAKQLGEHLKEQQEPFILEIYLFGKGYSKNNLKKTVILRCSKIVKAVVNKLVSIRNTQKAKKNSASGDVNSDGFSSLSSTTVFHSCSGSDTECRISYSQPDSVSSSKIGKLVEEKEIVTDRRLQWRRCREDNSKELSPVSVLEEISSNENSPLQNNRQRNAKARGCIIAIPFYKFMFESPVDEPSAADPSSQYFTGKRVSQETRVLEGRRRKHCLEIMGVAEIRKNVGENIRSWRKLSGNETNTNLLLHSNFEAFDEERRDFEKQIRGISAFIADAVLEHISEEIVVDMIELVEGNI